jgi:hypothetical protein
MRRTIIGKQSLKGRGALSNPPGRFDLQQLAPVDDGWYLEESPDSIATTLEPERAREIINTNDSRTFRSSNRSIRIEVASMLALLCPAGYADLNGRRMDSRNL